MVEGVKGRSSKERGDERNEQRGRPLAGQISHRLQTRRVK